jgi:hypothetical protein
MTHDRFRKPVRVSITIPWALQEALIARANSEGRSLSNLLAYLLEQSIQPKKRHDP